jgi:hypothetical protein
VRHVQCGAWTPNLDVNIAANPSRQIVNDFAALRVLIVFMMS